MLGGILYYCSHGDRRPAAANKTKGKAKQKVKRTEQAAPTKVGVAVGGAKTGELSCGVCQNQFQSRNKLFQQLKNSGHAVVLQAGGGEAGAGQKPTNQTAQSKKRRKKR